MEGLTSLVSSLTGAVESVTSQTSSGSNNSSQSSNGSDSSSGSQSSNGSNDSSQSSNGSNDSSQSSNGSQEEPEVRAPAPRQRRPKAEVAPKDAKTFFQAMSKNPKMYGFSPTGDMAILTETGAIDTTLPLPMYRETTSEERSEYRLGIQEEIRSVEKEYDESLKNLQDAIFLWKETGNSSDAIQIQRDLIRLDSKRSSLRSPLRWIRSYRNQDRSSLLLHSKQPALTIGHPVYSLYIQDLPFNKRLVETTGETKLPTIPEKEPEKDEEFIVFSVPGEETYGVLSPETPMDVTYNSTRYNSVLQAFYAERVGQLGNQGLRTNILKSTNPKTIRFMGSSMKGVLENPSARELIISIVREAAKQDKRIVPVLKNTGTDSLVYAELKDPILGIGLSVDQQDLVTHRNEWKGENLLGQAWEVVRSNLPDESVQSGGAVLEKARTLDDAKKERSQVLMGYYRKGKGFA